MSGPIRPNQVVQAKTAQIPEFVFDVVNNLIVKNWGKSSASITLDEVVREIRDQQAKADPKYRTLDPEREGWLAFEPIYESVGWEVSYGSGVFVFRK